MPYDHCDWPSAHDEPGTKYRQLSGGGATGGVSTAIAGFLFVVATVLVPSYLIAGLFTGCETTPATHETVEVRAYKAGRYGTHAYLIGRDHLTAQHREATRRAYLAFGLWLDAAHASGMESVRLDAEAVALIVSGVPDPYRGLAGEIMLEVVARVRDRIPADVAGLDSYRIALSVHRGIGDVLRERGIDPDAEVAE